MTSDSIEIRTARTSDVKQIRALIDTYAAPGRLLGKETVTLYESVQEFTVAVIGEKVVGCGALHVLWEDLAEVRTVAVAADHHRQGIGHKILDAIVSRTSSRSKTDILFNFRDRVFRKPWFPGHRGHAG